MSGDDIIVSVQNISKMYKLYDQPQDRLKQMLFGRFGKIYGREFWALRSANLEVRRGEVVGIIGQNGSGKSTLLQIVAGTLKPTTGSIQVEGRLTALLELGTGFNPEFTGRENVFMYGAILGIPEEEMQDRFDDIASFAQIGEFIDQPVKTYSSGMYVRLAFSVAASVDPEVLIVDEALSVGDAVYQSRCFRRMHEMRASGKTIILVTHNHHLVQSFCDRAMLLDQGEVLMLDDSKPVVNRYLEIIAIRHREYLAQFEKHRIEKLQKRIAAERGADDDQEAEHEVRQAEILEYYLLNEKKEKTVAWEVGEFGTIVIIVKFHAAVVKPTVSVIATTTTGYNVFGLDSRSISNRTGTVEAGTVLKTEFYQQIHLNPGEFVLTIGVVDQAGITLEKKFDIGSFKVIGKPKLGTSGLVSMDPEITNSIVESPDEAPVASG